SSKDPLLYLVHQAPKLLGNSPRGRERVSLGPIHPVRRSDVKEGLGDTGGFGTRHLSGERYNAEARGIVSNDEPLLGVSLHSQSALFPPNRSFELHSPTIGPFCHPAGRPRLSLTPRGGGRILL